MGFHSSTKVTNFRRGGVYFSDGVIMKDAQGIFQGVGTQHQYLATLLGAKTIDERGKAAIYDFEVNESSWKGNPPGSHASVYFDYSKVPEASKRDEMLLVAACLGIEPNDEKTILEVVTDEYLDAVTGPDNLFAGMGIQLPLTTKSILTKKNATPFTQIRFGVARNPAPR